MNTYFCFLIGAYALGAAVFLLKCRQARQPILESFYVLIGAMLAGLIGSKWGHVLFEAKGHLLSDDTLARNAWELIRDDPGHAFRFNDPGYVLLAGVLSGFALAGLWPKIRLYADQFLPAVAAGLALGRLGCYFTGCCGGTHGIPVQLIESGFALLLVWVVKDWRQALASYCLFRFGIEFIRADANRGIWALGLSTSQWICLALLTFLVKSSQLRQTRIIT